MKIKHILRRQDGDFDIIDSNGKRTILPAFYKNEHNTDPSLPNVGFGLSVEERKEIKNMIEELKQLGYIVMSPDEWKELITKINGLYKYNNDSYDDAIHDVLKMMEVK